MGTAPRLRWLQKQIRDTKNLVQLMCTMQNIYGICSQAQHNWNRKGRTTKEHKDSKNIIILFQLIFIDCQIPILIVRMFLIILLKKYDWNCIILGYSLLDYTAQLLNL